MATASTSRLLRIALLSIISSSMLLATTRAFQPRLVTATATATATNYAANTLAIKRSITRRNRSKRASANSSSDPATPTTLEWDHFDFSEFPKWDTRFMDSNTDSNTNSNTRIADTTQKLEDIIQEETKQDERTAQRLDRQWTSLENLEPQFVLDATTALAPYIQSARLDRINQVLLQRTRHCRFLFENPSNPSNVWACLRTMDSFGLQHVDMVVESKKYTGKAMLAQKKGMRTAMGSAQWLTIRNHATTKTAVERLKAKGYKLYASDLNPTAKDIRDITWPKDKDQKICIVMGNELTGISSEMRDLADETFVLPMSGFAESFNLSVATAITLAHLSAASREGEGPLQPGDLDDHELNCLRLKGILTSLAHPKVAKAVLNKAGLVLPPTIDWF